jgi:NAD(P)-dependent dehydrogenase (short-subunit alcohol dehydrogenase family)
MLTISLAGRSALVTGGGRGIGRAIALAFAKAGANVAITYRRDREAAESTVRDAADLGVRANAYCGSVENWDDDARVVGEVLSDLGEVNILVNNAGVAPRGNLIADTDPAEFDRLMGIHALGPQYLCKLLLPQMRKSGRGDLVFMSSVATLDFPAGGGPYNIAKAAAEALAFTLSKEERAHGIRSHIVAPGLTATEMGARGARAVAGVADIHELDSRSPFGRVSEPADVANLVAWLVSGANAYVNGQRIYVHGGG